MLFHIKRSGLLGGFLFGIVLLSAGWSIGEEPADKKIKTGPPLGGRWETRISFSNERIVLNASGNRGYAERIRYPVNEKGVILEDQGKVIEKTYFVARWHSRSSLSHLEKFCGRKVGPNDYCDVYMMRISKKPFTAWENAKDYQTRQVNTWYAKGVMQAHPSMDPRLCGLMYKGQSPKGKVDEGFKLKPKIPQKKQSAPPEEPEKRPYSVRLMCQAEGYQPWEKRYTVRPPDGLKLSGRVVYLDSQTGRKLPVPNALISLDNPKQQVRSNIQGYFSGILVAGEGAAGPAVEIVLKPEEDFAFEMTGYAPGHIESEVTVKVPGPDPQRLVITGQVRDNNKLPVPLATVSIPEYDEEVTADNDGHFTIDMEFVDGEGVKKITQNLTLEAVPDKLEFKLTSLEKSGHMPYPALANGAPMKMRITVLADGEPYPNRKMSIIYPKEFYFNGRSVSYIKSQVDRRASTWFTTDAKGQAEITLAVPMAAKDLPQQYPPRGLGESFGRPLFPVTGELAIEDMDSQKRGAMTMTYRNPYPMFTKCIFGRLHVGRWTEDKCVLKWKNPRVSKKTTISLSIPGLIQAPAQSGVTLTRGTSSSDLASCLTDTGKAFAAKDLLVITVDESQPNRMGAYTLWYGVKPGGYSADYNDQPETARKIREKLWQMAKEHAVTRFGGKITEGLGGELTQKGIDRIARSRLAQTTLGKHAGTVLKNRQQVLAMVFQANVMREMAQSQAAVDVAKTGKVSPETKAKLLQSKATIKAARQKLSTVKADTEHYIAKRDDMMNKFKHRTINKLAQSEIQTGNTMRKWNTSGGPLRGKDYAASNNGLTSSKMAGYGAGGITAGMTAVQFYDAMQKEGGPTFSDYGDLCIGGAETSLAFSSKLQDILSKKLPTGQAEAILAMKMAWESAKILNEDQKEFLSIADGWDENNRYPAIIKITNEAGYTITRSYMITVHYSEKNTQEGRERSKQANEKYKWRQGGGQ